MGLLDSPYVGQLSIKGNYTGTPSSTAYLLNPSLSVVGFNSIIFKVTVNSGSLSSEKYIQLWGQIGNSSLNPMNFYSVPENKPGRDTMDDVVRTNKVTGAGYFISENLSDVTNVNFRIITNASVGITIDYWLCNTSFSIKSIDNKLSNVLTAVNGSETLIKQQVVDCSSTGSNTITGIKALVGNRKYIRVVFDYSEVDTNLVAYFQMRRTSTSSRYSPITVDESGNFVKPNPLPVDSANKSLSYYIKNFEDILFFRVDTGGASGLTCTVRIYGTDYCPEGTHIQTLFKKSINNSTTQISEDVNLAKYPLENFKFVFFTVGDGGNTSYPVTGSISKNWTTNEEEDSTVIAEFTSGRNVFTKWYPITNLAGKITFNLTGSSNSGKYTIAMYGVV